jgi:hypothetical protein
MVCRSDGSGPVTVGYVPVQYDTVVEMLGDGKMKLTAASPYDMTLVMARAPNKDVALKLGETGDVTCGEVVVVNVKVEVRVLAEEEEEVKLVLRVVDEFALGSCVTNPVEVLGLSMLVKGVLDESNDNVELDVRAGVSEDVTSGSISVVDLGSSVAEVRDSDGLNSVGRAIEELSTLSVRSGLRPDEIKLVDRAVDVVESGGVGPVEDGSEEPAMLLLGLGVGPGRLDVIVGMSAEKDGPGEGRGRDTVKPSLRVEESNGELPAIDVPVMTVVEPSDTVAVNDVRTLEGIDKPDSDRGSEDMPPGVVDGIPGSRAGRLLDGATGEVIVSEGVDIVDGERRADSVETVGESPLLIVTALVEAGYDG